MADDATYYTMDDTGAYVEAAMPSFHESLPEEIREHESIKDMDAGSLAQAYIDLKTSQPQIPESPDGYEGPEVPEGLPVDDEAMAGFKSLAHELKLTPDQVKKIIEYDFQRAQRYIDADRQETEDAATEIKRNRDAATAALNKEWGSGREAKMELIAKLKTKFLDEDTIKEWDKAGLGDDPKFLKFLAAIGEVMDEDRLILPDERPGEIPRGPDGRPILRYDHPTSRNR